MSIHDTHYGYADLSTTKSWEQLGGAFVCVVCAALAAGLTVVRANGVVCSCM